MPFFPIMHFVPFFPVPFFPCAFFSGAIFSCAFFSGAFFSYTRHTHTVTPSCSHVTREIPCFHEPKPFRRIPKYNENSSKYPKHFNRDTEKIQWRNPKLKSFHLMPVTPGSVPVFIHNKLHIINYDEAHHNLHILN